MAKINCGLLAERQYGEQYDVYPRALFSLTLIQELPVGCRCILAGANGAGKSCMLRTIGGLYQYEGNINVLSKEAFRPSIWGKVTNMH
jgi:ABC-type Mn2+/Zn2+ transport system ATPase subunit